MGLCRFVTKTKSGITDGQFRQFRITSSRTITFCVIHFDLQNFADVTFTNNYITRCMNVNIWKGVIVHFNSHSMKIMPQKWKIFIFLETGFIFIQVKPLKYGSDMFLPSHSILKDYHNKCNLQWIFKSIIQLHDGCLVPTAIAVVRRAEDRHNVPIMTPVVPLKKTGCLIWSECSSTEGLWGAEVCISPPWPADGRGTPASGR